MKESVLHYVWQQKLFINQQMTTTDGESVEIIDVGRLNTDAGPDFFNAKIKIGETLWAGNVEIHRLSSDWEKHRHDTNPAYNSVILHVVLHADTKIFRSDGALIPQLELQYPSYIDQNYELILENQKWIPCESRLKNVPSIVLETWKNALLTERLEQKINHIQHLLNDNANNWEETFYIILARSFGFGTNSQAFEALAKSLPVSILSKHKNQLFQLESLLLGQAGLLTDEKQDEYSLKLKQEYTFLRTKYSLVQLNSSIWKLLRLRPDNFPHVRIAQFAALIHKSSKLFSKMLDQPEVISLQQMFRCEPSDYWLNHYTIGQVSRNCSKKLGIQSINTILINTVIPFLFCYAKSKNDQILKNKAITLFENIPAEQNAIIKRWKELGIASTTAFDSQALIQLKKQYCDEKKCLRCRIGNKILAIAT